MAAYLESPILPPVVSCLPYHISDVHCGPPPWC